MGGVVVIIAGCKIPENKGGSDTGNRGYLLRRAIVTIVAVVFLLLCASVPIMAQEAGPVESDPTMAETGMPAEMFAETDPDAPVEAAEVLFGMSDDPGEESEKVPEPLDEGSPAEEPLVEEPPYETWDYTDFFVEEPPAEEIVISKDPNYDPEDPESDINTLDLTEDPPAEEPPMLPEYDPLEADQDCDGITVGMGDPNDDDPNIPYMGGDTTGIWDSDMDGCSDEDESNLYGTDPFDSDSYPGGGDYGDLVI